MVRDLDRDVAAPFLEAGAKRANKPKAMAIACEIIITCLPSPAASAAVMETEDGVLAGLSAGKIWAEMSTTDAVEVARLGALVEVKGDSPIGMPSVLKVMTNYLAMGNLISLSEALVTSKMAGIDLNTT